MIKFLAERDGRPMIGLGLSRGNCERLLANKPIFIDLKVMAMDLNPPPNFNEATILIFGGEDEDAMVGQLQQITGQNPPQKTHHEEN